MNPNIIKAIKKDIERCEAQTDESGSEELYRALIAKYSGIFPGFSDNIFENAKATAVGSFFDYRPELKIVKEKLEMQLLVANEQDPLHNFKEMYSDDLERLKKVIEDTNGEISENKKQQLYKEVTAKYYSYVPQLGDGLYEYNTEFGFFAEVFGSTLDHNLAQVYYKMNAYQSLGFPGLSGKTTVAAGPVINLTTKNENHNINENTNAITVSFDDVRKKISGMTALSDEEVEEIQSKINELEKIVKSSDIKNKKWSKAKEIIKWIADKGVDVGIALLPLLLEIK